MCIRAAYYQGIGAARRRMTCEANKSSERVLNQLRSEISDVRSKAVFCTIKGEAVTKWEVEATLGQIIRLYTKI